MYQKTRYLNTGDKAIVLEFGNKINKETNLLVRKMSLQVYWNVRGTILLTIYIEYILSLQTSKRQ